MSISPEIIFQIRMGKTAVKESAKESVKEKVFKDLQTNICSIKKQYEENISQSLCDELARSVFEKCLKDFNFPEQNFELFFAKRFNNAIKSLTEQPRTDEVKDNSTNCAAKDVTITPRVSHPKIVLPEAAIIKSSISQESIMIISPDTIFQIRRGNLQLKCDVLQALLPIINNYKKQYGDIIGISQFDELISSVFEKCLSEFNFPEQIFQLFFAKKISESIKSQITQAQINKANDNPSNCSKKDTAIPTSTKHLGVDLEDDAAAQFPINPPKVDLEKDVTIQTSISEPKIDSENDVINNCINDGNEMNDVEEIAEKLRSLLPQLKLILPEDLDYVFESLINDNKRLQNYLKILIKANYKFKNFALDRLLLIGKFGFCDNQNDDSLSLDSFNIFRREIDKYPLLSKPEEEELFRKYHEGDNTAKDLLVKSNLRLVLFRIKKYFGFGFDKADLAQEGSLGLIKAIENFDPSRGAKFSYFATSCIDHKIYQALALHGRTIRIPAYMLEKFYRDRKALTKKELELGRELTLEEEMKVTGLNEKTLTLYKTIIGPKTYSNDQDVKDNTGHNYKIYPNMRASELKTEDQALGNVFYEHICRCIKDSDLSDREKQILSLRYGLDNKEPLSIKAISDIYGLSHQRVYKILEAILKKLRDFPELTSKDQAAEIIKKPSKPKKIVGKRALFMTRPNSEENLDGWPAGSKLNTDANMGPEKQNNVIYLSTKAIRDFVYKMVSCKDISYTRENVAALLSITTADADQLISDSLKKLAEESGDRAFHL